MQGRSIAQRKYRKIKGYISEGKNCLKKLNQRTQKGHRDARK